MLFLGELLYILVNSCRTLLPSPLSFMQRLNIMILFLILFFFLSTINYNVTFFLVVYVYFLSVGSFGEGPHHKFSLCFSEEKRSLQKRGKSFLIRLLSFPWLSNIYTVLASLFFHKDIFKKELLCNFLASLLHVMNITVEFLKIYPIRIYVSHCSHWIVAQLIQFFH